MRSKLCFLMTWFCMWQIKLTFMQCNMVKVIWTFWRMKLGLLLQFYCCQGIAKFHIEIFIGQMHLIHTMNQSHVQWAEIDFERYHQTFIWLTTHRLQKIALREMCPNAEFFLFHIFPYSDRMRMREFSPNVGIYGPEKTPYLDNFHAV